VISASARSSSRRCGVVDAGASADVPPTPERPELLELPSPTASVVVPSLTGAGEAIGPTT
jgi:hypothetical protein